MRWYIFCLASIYFWYTFSLALAEIPIEINLLNKDTYVVPSKPQLLSETEIFGPRKAFAQKQKVKIYNWTYSNDYLDVSLQLLWRKENKGATFLLMDNKNSVMRVKQNSQNIKSCIGVCGFKVPLEIDKYFPLQIGRVGYGRVNIKNPKGLQYSLNRKELLNTKEKENVTIEIVKIFNEGIRNFLRHTNSDTPQKIHQLCIEAKKHGGENDYNSWTEDRFWFYFNQCPDLITYKFFKVEKGKSISEAEIVYMTLNDLKNMNCEIWTCQDFMINEEYRFNIDYIMQYVYSYVSIAKKNNKDQFITYPSLESSMLFDCNPDSYIWQFRFTNEKHKVSSDINLMCIPIKNSMKNMNINSVIGQIQGKWSGTIYERFIFTGFGGPSFVFNGRSKFIVAKNSYLSSKIKKLYNENNHFKLSDLIFKLYEAQLGNIDQELVKEFPELFR